MTTPTSRRLGWAGFGLVFLALAVVLLATGCGPVEDGGGKKGAPKFVGGRVQNSKDSVQPIDAYFDWGTGPKGKRSVLSAGETTPGSKDSDGFCLRDYPAELTTTTVGLFGPITSKSTRGRGECVKISDNDSVLVKVVKRLNNSKG